MRLIHEIKIPSRTPITTKMVLETFKVIYKTEETAAMSTFSYLICSNPTIWVVKRETIFGDLWEVRRGLIKIDIQYIEEIEWIVNTLKQSYRKRYEVEPEKEIRNRVSTKKLDSYAIYKYDSAVRREDAALIRVGGQKF